jgi:hypothetical protein
MAGKKTGRVNYAKLISPDSFIGQYLEYCSESETPTAYDFWTACFLLSVALGRGVVVDRPSAPVYLNLFLVLVAESGVTRKSTAVRRATNFARVLCNESSPLVESKTTPEKLEYDLWLQTKKHGTAFATICIDEMVKFLGRERYVEQMPTLLTDLYDSPSVRQGGGTLSRGSQELANVFVNFLSASTPSWLLRAVNPDVIEGGFTSRVIFVVEEKPKRNNPWPEGKNDALRTVLQSRLGAIREFAHKVPNIAVTPAARNVFASWYRRRDIKRDPFRSSFQSREDGHILRLAALLSINDDIWQIQVPHITAAIRVIEECRELGARIFEGTGSNSRMVLGIDALRDKLLAAGLSGIKQGELTKQLQGRLKGEEIVVGLNIMQELGFVQRFEQIQVAQGRPFTLWRATQQLAQSKAMDKILDGMHPR